MEGTRIHMHTKFRPVVCPCGAVPAVYLKPVSVNLFSAIIYCEVCNPEAKLGDEYYSVKRENAVGMDAIKAAVTDWNKSQGN